MLAKVRKGPRAWSSRIPRPGAKRRMFILTDTAKLQNTIRYTQRYSKVTLLLAKRIHRTTKRQNLVQLFKNSFTNKGITFKCHVHFSSCASVREHEQNTQLFFEVLRKLALVARKQFGKWLQACVGLLSTNWHYVTKLAALTWKWHSLWSSVQRGRNWWQGRPRSWQVGHWRGAEQIWSESYRQPGTSPPKHREEPVKDSNKAKGPISAQEGFEGNFIWEKNTIQSEHASKICQKYFTTISIRVQILSIHWFLVNSCPANLPFWKNCKFWRRGKDSTDRSRWRCIVPAWC